MPRLCRVHCVHDVAAERGMREWTEIGFIRTETAPTDRTVLALASSGS
jgi:hypothetical protein